MQADTLQENIHLQTGWIRQGHSKSLAVLNRDFHSQSARQRKGYRSDDHGRTKAG